MVREIMKDVFFLAQKSEPATEADLQVARDLLDTLKAHAEECVGMAANMIGVKKRNIAVNMGLVNVAMLNPVILKKSGPFETEEGCLSLTGTRKAKRFREIELEYQDLDMKKHVQKFTGWTAQIIQHECDHLEGIII
jgi:peptide deformylase